MVTCSETELKFIVNEVILQKLAELKNLIGDQSLAKIFELSLDAKLLSERKKRGHTSETTKPETNAPRKSVQILKTSPSKTQPAGECANQTQNLKVIDFTNARFSRYIPIHLKRIVFQRSNGQCEYIDPTTQKRCDCKFRLQIDHVRPIALGGKTSRSNLRSLCSAHNLRMAREMGIFYHPKK
jgi:hypothetical protein